MNQEVGGSLKLTKYERVVRRLCELKFSEFVKEAGPLVIQGFEWGPHLQVMCDHLQATFEGKVSRLMINVPPGLTKSTLVSVLFPAWVWANDATKSFLCITYNQDLTERDSIACREMIGSDWYQARWGHKVRVVKGRDSRTFYKLSRGGWRLSTTAGGRATGDHPDFIIGDDVMSVEGSKRASIRLAFMTYYRDTLSTRGITKGCRHIFAMQRLHVDDPCGHWERENEQAVALGEEEPWYVLKLPMRYDPMLAMKDRGFGGDWRKVPGELVNPNRLGEDAVKRLERSLGSQATAAQLQQGPKRRDGEFFKLTMLRMIRESELPTQFDAVVRFWDRAASVDQGSYTAGGLMGRKGNKFYVLHMYRKRVSAGEVEAAIEHYVKLDEITYGFDRLQTLFEIEGGSSGVRVAEITQNRLRGHRVKGVRAKDSKEVHADPLAIAIENGEVYVVEGPWVPDLLDEMEDFPEGTYKDQTDSLAGAYLELANPSKKTRNIVVSEDIDMGYGKSAESCQNPGCNRPAFENSGFCCDSCQRLAPEGERCRNHTAECATAYNNWFIENSD